MGEKVPLSETLSWSRRVRGFAMCGGRGSFASFELPGRDMRRSWEEEEEGGRRLKKKSLFVYISV